MRIEVIGIGPVVHIDEGDARRCRASRTGSGPGDGRPLRTGRCRRTYRRSLFGPLFAEVADLVGRSHDPVADREVGDLADRDRGWSSSSDLWNSNVSLPSPPVIETEVDPATIWSSPDPPMISSKAAIRSWPISSAFGRASSEVDGDARAWPSNSPAYPGRRRRHRRHRRRPPQPIDMVVAGAA